MTTAEEEFREMVRAIAHAPDEGLAWKKRTIAQYRGFYMKQFFLEERVVDAIIEGVLADCSCKVRKALTIKKYTSLSDLALRKSRTD